MNQFPTAREAKEFLISGILAEAQREHVSLSETERKMLYFSETAWTLPDIMDVYAAFEGECDSAQYEKKMARLIRTAFHRARRTNPEQAASWINAVRKLKKEDHYILVMAGQAGLVRGSIGDKWKTLLLVVIFICAIVAFEPVMRALGLWLPGRGREFGSFTINERLSNFLGYAWLCLVALFVCGLTYAHFDRKRRLYGFLGQLVARVVHFFVPRKDRKTRRAGSSS